MQKVDLQEKIIQQEYLKYCIGMKILIEDRKVQEQKYKKSIISQLDELKHSVFFWKLYFLDILQLLLHVNTPVNKLQLFLKNYSIFYSLCIVCTCHILKLSISNSFDIFKPKFANFISALHNIGAYALQVFFLYPWTRMVKRSFFFNTFGLLI